jgi:CRISPR-associated protein Csm3
MSNTNKAIYQFLGNYIIRGKIECLTGLHIGGSSDKLEIGGVDAPVIRNPHSKYPYIPGSSIKGKMRHLLEFSTGAVTNPVKGKLGNVSKSENIVRIFGIGADDKDNDKTLGDFGPTRLIVRDCNPDETTIKMWRDLDSELLYTEYKPENTIDRLTAAANPRFIERVVAGSNFTFEMIYSVYNINEENHQESTQRDLENLSEALRLLESSALGKSGSRGYGQIKFHIAEPLFITSEDYKKGSDKYKKANEDLKTLKKKDLKTLVDIQLTYNG